MGGVVEEAPSVLSLCQAQSWSILAGDETSILHRQICVVGLIVCLQELLVTFLLVLCPSDKSPITASEDGDTFLETWQPAVTVVTKLQQLSHH